MNLERRACPSAQDGVNAISGEGEHDARQIQTGDIHHLRLTVTDLQRSREFYTRLLGFQVAVESPPPDDPAADEVFKILFGGVVMIRGNLLMGLRPMAPVRSRADNEAIVLGGIDDPSQPVAGRRDSGFAAHELRPGRGSGG
jgi:glyoxylase I family protein